MADALPTWKLKLLYDGLCPACKAEVKLLRSRNASGALAFEDIADPAFDPSPYGLTLNDVVGSMHAIQPDGTILRGVDVFARAYELVGWRWMSALLRAPVLRVIARLGYAIFARVRPRFSKFDPHACVDGRCALPTTTTDASGRRG